jgi:hypothetical protein
MKKLVVVLALPLCLIAQDRGARVVQPAATSRRLALIIGNNDYRNQQPLRNSVNDANAMGDGFRALGFEVVLEWMRNNGPKPRHRWNRLLFLAADQGALSRLGDATRIALAWDSIVDDVKEGRLNIDQLQKKQAEEELQTAEEVLPRVAPECYKWLLCPVQENPTDAQASVEAFPLNTTGGGRERDGARLHRERTRHNDVVAHSSAHETQRALLEGGADGGRRYCVLGGRASIPLSSTPERP